MKKFLSALLAIILLFSFTACFPEETSEPQKLATPTSVACNDDGLITWGSVENATEYVDMIYIFGTAAPVAPAA